MRVAVVAVCLLVVTAGCIVKTEPTPTPTTTQTPASTPTTPERIDEKAERPEQPKTPSSAEYEVNVSEMENAVRKEMNERRVEHGVKPLNRSEKLHAIARYKSWDMAQNDYFAHAGPNNESYGYLRNRYSAGCPYVAQNLHRTAITDNESRIQDRLGKENQTAVRMVNSLMNSTPHRENILNPEFEVQGIGVFVDKNGTVFLTQEFCG